DRETHSGLSCHSFVPMSYLSFHAKPPIRRGRSLRHGMRTRPRHQLRRAAGRQYTGGTDRQTSAPRDAIKNPVENNKHTHLELHLFSWSLAPLYIVRLEPWSRRSTMRRRFELFVRSRSQ